MKKYLFIVSLYGEGTNPEEAWEDASEAVELDGLGEMPESADISIESED